MTNKGIMVAIGVLCGSFLIGCATDPGGEAGGPGGGGKADDMRGECTAEGQGFESFTPDGMCCEGLTAVPAATPTEGGCASPRCPCYVCVACGDGVCGEGENECNCAEDCSLVDPECATEGEGFEGFETEGVCCDGLVAIQASEVVDGECRAPRCPCYVCAACGDGVCGEGENECNCAEDCERPPVPECVAEGGGFESFTPDGMCCEGLTAVSAAVETSSGCSSPRCPCYVCVVCGDGVCGEGENACNCADDCG